MSRSNAITRRTADIVQAAIADGVPIPAGPSQALQAPGLATNQRPSAVAPDVTVDRYDHAAAAAYLMRHHGAVMAAPARHRRGTTWTATPTIWPP